MADQQQRRVRLRLARQGTAPARVRARVRDDQQLTDTNPEQQTRKRIPWVHIGTVIGAVAAIGSLVFTGVATYYGAVVAQKQLEQSREDNEMRERDQATRVTFWEENSFWGEGRAIHLVNRSPDPVTNVDVRINVTYKGKEYLLLLTDTNLPPCTEVVFKVRSGSVKRAV